MVFYASIRSSRRSMRSILRFQYRVEAQLGWRVIDFHCPPDRFLPR